MPDIRVTDLKHYFNIAFDQLVIERKVINNL